MAEAVPVPPPAKRKKMVQETNPNESSFTARPYQDQILDYCLEKNTIIYLPTGAGKTFIALMAMKRMAQSGFLEKPLAEGGKRSVFLVNTVVLAHQQRDSIESCTNLKTSVYTGDMNVDAWRRDKWYTEFDENQVLVATCQIILDVIRHGFIEMKHLNLLIFDECHHGRRDHPMHQLMNHYNTARECDRPKIIGLTGMLISGAVKLETVVPELEALENTFHSTIVTVKDMQEFQNVLLFSTNPNEIIVKFTTSVKTPLMTRLELFVERLVKQISDWPVDEKHQKSTKNKLKLALPNPIKHLKSLLNDFVYQMNDTGIYGASISILSVLVDFELKKRAADTTPMRYLLRHLITAVEQIRHIIVQEMEEEDDDNEAIITSNSSAKMVNLIYYLKRFFNEPENRDSRALVFVERRYSAKCIYHILKLMGEKSTNFLVRPDFMVGNNNNIPESIEAILENKWNRRVLERFKKNETNLIVASSVLEEGIDLQMCNLVISYDSPKTFRSFVQSKGRARVRDSSYVIFESVDKYNGLMGRIKEYHAIDDRLKTYLIGKALDRPPPLEEEITKEFADKLIKPYVTEAGAVLEALSSISLLNRYCMTLPADVFTSITVSWSKEETPSGIVVKVLLPMQSTVREEILSDPMPNIKMAKRSAAFKACVELHKKGELNDNLMPINVKRCLDQYDELYFNIWKKYPNDSRFIAGTKKSVREYQLQYPKETTSATPTLNKLSYLYKISMTTSFTINENDYSSKVFKDLYESEKTFGILTANKLPALGEMSTYVTLGQIRVKIEKEPIWITINELHELTELRKFHGMLFRELLRTTQDFLAYDYSNKENSFFIVPMENGDIDWQIVRQFQQLSVCVKTKIDERKQLQFNPNDYLYKVVTPWYRDDIDQRYIVTKIHDDLTPNSPFPNPSYASFASYITETYGQSTENNTQFLIETKGITNKLKRLTPGIGVAGSKKYTYHGPELLIPEFCHNYHFPGDLWLKATLIPSILHRLHYLLLAEKMRTKINSLIGIKNNERYLPKPVIENMKLKPLYDDIESLNVKKVPRLPNTDYVEPKYLAKNDFVSISESSSWHLNEEPIDFNRNTSKIYSVELDYYHNFITEKMKKIKLNDNPYDQADIVRNNSCRITKRKPYPITNDDKQLMHINVLDIQRDTITNGPEQCDLLAAITLASSADVFNMECLEVLGDSYLKFAVSIYLIHTHPTWHEGFLTACKGKIVSNRNLLYQGIERSIGGMLNVHGFEPKSDWAPPLFSVPRQVLEDMIEINAPASLLYKLKPSNDEIIGGTLNSNTLYDFVSLFMNDQNHLDTTLQTFFGKQRVSDKCIADCIEAIIGCCVKSIGVDRTFLILQMFDILPKTAPDYSTMLRSKTLNPRLRTNISNRDVDLHLTNYHKLEEILDYKFNDRAYLLQALTHPSYPTNQITGCYQQLEFLGDAVLDFLITLYITERCTDMDPGELSDLRSALVNNNTLACILVRYDIHKHILSQSAVLSEIVDKFVCFQDSQEHLVTESVMLLITETDDNMAEYIDVPKMLGDVFEAIIGGIFLDTHYNLSETWRVIYRLMQIEIHQFIKKVPVQIVRQLYEFPGAHPKFEDPRDEEDFVVVSVRFTCNGEILSVSGFGQNKEDAKRAAAKTALTKLNQ